MPEKMKKNVKGITLVALVVTIIVLLILAGIAINLTIGNNGLFSRAQNAVNVWDKATENETKAIDEFIKVYDNEVMNNSESNQKRYYFKLNGIDCYWTEEENYDGQTGAMDWLEKHVKGLSFQLIWASEFECYIDSNRLYDTSSYYYYTFEEGGEVNLFYAEPSEISPDNYTQGKLVDLSGLIHYD